MAFANKKPNGAKFTTPIGRLSFPAIISPKLKYKSTTEFEYVTDILFDENTDLSAIEKACDDAMAEYYGADKKKWPTNIVHPLTDQEVLIEKAEKAGYGADHLQAGAMYMKAKTNAANGSVVVVDAQMGKVTNEALVYGGVYARISGVIKVNPIQGVDPRTKKPITTVYITPYLSGVQIVRDGDRFGGGTRRAEDMFDAVAFDDTETESSSLE